MKKVIEFDKFIQEKNAETITVKAFGEEIQVKAEIPAIVPVMLARAENENDLVTQAKITMKAADIMLGKEMVDKLCEKGIGSKELASLIEKLFSEINGTDDDEEGQELSDEESRVTPVGNGRHGKK